MRAKEWSHYPIIHVFMIRAKVSVSGPILKHMDDFQYGLMLHVLSFNI